MKTLLLFILMLASSAFGETIPAKPIKYFNDYANLITPEQASMFNEQLAQFERDTSNQFVVAIYPMMDTESDAPDYTQRIAQSWGVGQKDKRNGLVLFIFMKTGSGHGRIQAQVGYGLEGAIPDITAKKITDDISHYFKRKEYQNGIGAGIAGFMMAAKSEHAGTGKTVAETPPDIDFSGCVSALLWILPILGVIGGIIYFIYLKREAKRELEEAEAERLRKEQWAEYEKKQAERRAEQARIAEKKRREWEEYLKNETPDQRKKRLAREAAAAAAAALAAAALAKQREKEEEEEENRRRRSRNDDDSYSSSSYGGYSYGGSSDSSSYSSDSSSSFSSGGGDFGGGGGGSDF